MKEISERYADKIHTIEVTNEMFWWGGWITDFYLAPDFMEWCYQKAAEYFPNNELCINEWTGAIWDTRACAYDAYYMMIENLLMKGCRIDAIGAQYHMFQRVEKYFSDTRKFYNLPHLFEALDNYGRFKNRLKSPRLPFLRLRRKMQTRSRRRTYSNVCIPCGSPTKMFRRLSIGTLRTATRLSLPRVIWRKVKIITAADFCVSI